MIKTLLKDPKQNVSKKIPTEERSDRTYLSVKSPRHVAIIMDGNRRWAKNRGLSSEVGHMRGAEQLKKIVEFAAENSIETLTVFALSTENINRSQRELNLLYSLFESYLKSELESMVQNKISLKVIGSKKELPGTLLQAIEEAEYKTQGGSKMNLVIALNYGGRDELVRAFNKIHLSVRESDNSIQISEKLISQNLDTAPWGDPELIIRTSGECRLSNFLLWQASYSEMYFSKELWPDFSIQHLKEALLDYQKREIRRGT